MLPILLVTVFLSLGFERVDASHEQRIVLTLVELASCRQSWDKPKVTVGLSVVLETCLAAIGRIVLLSLLFRLLIEALREVKLDDFIVEFGDRFEILQELHRSEQALIDRVLGDLEQLLLSQLRHIAEEEGLFKVHNVDTPEVLDLLPLEIV